MIGSLTSIQMFVAAYEEGTFTAAAARENSTQSGVSQHISQLEYALGVKLFIRAKAGVSPTPAARSFYNKCVELLRAHHHAMESTRRFGQGLEGDVIVGLMPTLSQVALAPSLMAFSAAHPNVRLLVFEGFSANLTDRLLAGEMDFAITPAFEGRSGIHMRHFSRVPEVLVSSRENGPPHRTAVALRDQPPLKLVVPSIGNTRRQTIESYCTAHGAKIDRVMELDSVAGTLDFVERSDWSAILPILAVLNRMGENGLSVSPIQDPELELDMITISRANRAPSAAAEVFREILADTIDTLTQGWRDSIAVRN